MKSGIWRVLLNGETMFVPNDPGNSDYHRVQQAIADGVIVVLEQDPIITREQQEEARRMAYQAEADPLFFMAQRGEATIEQWTAKVTEIKARYPYP